MTGQQRVGDDFLQPPAGRDRQQVLLALRFRDLDQVVFAEARGLPQHRSGDGDFVMPCQVADNRGRRLGDRRELGAYSASAMRC